ncbi:MAG: HAD family hydrolase [Bacillota bacterium]
MGKWSVVLFDYGGTLVDFYRNDQFHQVLREALTAARSAVLEAGEEVPPGETMWARGLSEDYESPDNRVRPLERRLARIFAVERTEVLESAAVAFTRAVTAVGRTVPGAHSTLTSLTGRGYRLGLVSNTPWGCPGVEWLRDLEDRGLSQFFERMVSCSDIGLRKPAPEVYGHVSDLFAVEPGDCLFVGDDPRWDFCGPRSVGMDALLFDRRGREDRRPSVRTLGEIVPYLEGQL